jgi:hypothetical protein
MKQLLVLFALVAFCGLNATAQDCSYSKNANAKVDKTHCKATAAAAAKLASMDENIESRTCPQSGKVSYVRKSVCSTSGKVSFTDVEYCSKSAKFINVSPSKKQNCIKGDAQKASQDVKATKVSSTSKAKKNCAASCAKPCTGSKAKAEATPKTQSSGAAKVKLVKNER